MNGSVAMAYARKPVGVSGLSRVGREDRSRQGSLFRAFGVGPESIGRGADE
jgi:hypothetical protein